MVDEYKLDQIADVIRQHWPVEIDNSDLQERSLIEDVVKARSALLAALNLIQLA